MLPENVENRPRQAVRESILVIEDDQDIQDLVRYNLTREGYRVKSVLTGEDGLNRIRHETPDLIVLDIMLPGIDGLEVCKFLKENRETRHIPIIIVTARGEDADVVAGLELGADDFVAKPFSPRVLVARIRSLLRRAKSQRGSEQAPLTVGRLQIFPGRHEVRIDSREISLSITEFGILALLARSPGWVFSRSQIVNEVRGQDTIVTDRSVDVHIAGLRKKLGPYSDYIQTVRGVGYRLKSLEV